MTKKNKRIVENSGVRYVFFGGVTTVVNLAVFWILSNVCGIDLITANVISIFTAITFAYLMNKWFVFEYHTETVRELSGEIGTFFGMRTITMLIEVFGVVLCVSIWKFPVMASKLALQVVILILNYVFGRLYVFREQRAVPGERERFWIRQRRENVVLSVGICLAVMIAGYIALQVWPFGDHGMLIIDSLHQYLPFFTEFQQKLNDGSTLLYSTGGGLGFNFWSTVAYYLSSPFNYLLAFVSMDHVMDFMDWMIVAKVAACGGIFTWYLCKKGEERKEYTWFLPAAFGCMFALGNFLLGYYFNLMWLDSIAVTPLVMYGIEQLNDGKSGKLFGLSLSYGLFCNYYVGYMLCLFACLYWLVNWFEKDAVTVKRVAKSAGMFTVYAFLAAGMAGIVLFPAYKGLGLSASADSSFPTAIKWYSDGVSELTSLFAFTEPINIADTQEGLNAFCGSIVLILTVLFLLDNRLKVRERISKLLLVGLFYLSFHLNYLNYIWHGFHIQNGLPNRFAFLFCLLLLTMGFRVLGHIRKIPAWRVLVSFVPAMVFVIIAQIKGWGDREVYVYIATLVLVGLYGFLLLAMAVFKQKRRLLTNLLTGLLCAEMVFTGIHGLMCNGNVGRSTYIDDQKAFQALMDEEEPSELFYRSDIDSARMRNEAMFMGGGGLVLFNSVMPGCTEDFCKAVGIEARMNKNGYNGLTKLMNDVLGIRYVFSKENTDHMYQMERVDTSGPLTMYRNDNALAPAFVVNSDIKDWDIYENSDPCETQNRFVYLATGEDSIFVLDRIIEAEDGVENRLRIPANKQVYASLKTTVANVELVTPEYTRNFNKFNAHLYDFGVYPTDSEGSITLELKPSQSKVDIKLYTCPQDRYEQVLTRLKESPLILTSSTDGHVEGTVDAKQSGTLLITFTCDPGWSVWIDGVKTEVYPVGEALMGVDITAGEHTVVMDYTPQGLTEGSILSLVCVVLFFLVRLAEEKRKKKTEITE